MTSNRRSRRHRNPHGGENEQPQPFFSPQPVQTKAEQPFFQPKLAIGHPGDKYEQEADAVAEQVVSGQGQAPAVQQKEISAIQRTSLATPVEDEKLGTAEARMEKDKLVQEKPEVQREAAPEEEEPVQMMEGEEEEVQMQPEEEEPVQMMEGEEEEVQMQPEEEEPVQMMEGEEEEVQMQEEEEEPLQMMEGEEEEVQMQEEEEEPVHMMEGEEEEVQMQQEEEEPVQMMEGEEEEVQMQQEEEEPVQMMGGEEEEVQMQQEEEEPMQMKTEAGNTTASPRLSSRIQDKAGNGRPLPGKARTEMEQAFGTDFSGVNVHTDTEAVQMNKELGAQAFTHGKDVYFNSGKYSPESTAGKRLLAHELTHVVQQGGGSKKVPEVQGFFKKAWRKIKKAAKKVGGAIVSGTKAVGRAAKSVWKGLNQFGKKLWEKSLGILHRIKRFITGFPARLKRLAKHLWNGVKSLKPWSLSWWKSLGKASTWKSFAFWLGEYAIYSLEIIGIGEMYETLMDFIKFNTRPLTAAEIATAKSVFGNSIDYSLVRVDEHAILGPSWSKRAYVSFHTINNWGATSPSLLIHELTHVWQYQRMGAMYMPRAIHAQKSGGYNYGGIPALETNKHRGMSAFNLEQQGDVLADYYKIKNGMVPSWGSGTIADLPLYEIYVNDVRKK